MLRKSLCCCSVPARCIHQGSDAVCGLTWFLKEERYDGLHSARSARAWADDGIGTRSHSFSRQRQRDSEGFVFMTIEKSTDRLT